MKHKDYYNDDYIFSISKKIHSVMPDFDEKNFCQSLAGWMIRNYLQGLTLLWMLCRKA